MVLILVIQNEIHEKDSIVGFEIDQFYWRAATYFFKITQGPDGYFILCMYWAYD